MKRMLAALLTVSALGVPSSAWPQGIEDTYFVSVSGAALDDIVIAWRALQAQYEPETPLDDFWISYTRGRADGPATIEFRLGPRYEQLEGGSVRIDPRTERYEVTVTGQDAVIVRHDMHDIR